MAGVLPQAASDSLRGRQPDHTQTAERIALTIRACLIGLTFVFGNNAQNEM